MYARLLSYPPLGQTTTLAAGSQSVRFTVLIESSQKNPWNVALWHNFDNQERWTSLSLQPLDRQPSTITVHASQELNRQWFTIHLEGPPKNGSCRVSFTLAFRASESDSWKWSNEQFSTSDGHLLYQLRQNLDQDLPVYFDRLPAYLNIQQETSDTPDTVLWTVTSPVSAASGKDSGYANNKLGRPLSFSRWFALVRLWSPWLAPRQGVGAFKPDKEAVLAAFERSDGTHLVVLALSGIDDILTCLQHDGNGCMLINSRNDREEDGHAKLVVAVGRSVDDAVAATMYHARKIVMSYEAASGQLTEEFKALTENLKPEWLEDWYDGLTYCTWNGLGQNLSEEKVFTALDSLAANDISITGLIIGKSSSRFLIHTNLRNRR
jgi:hypothetical protein